MRPYLAKHALYIGSGGFGGAAREMRPAVCAQWGADSRVPFRPQGDRPVYCNDCFSSMRRQKKLPLQRLPYWFNLLEVV